MENTTRYLLEMASKALIRIGVVLTTRAIIPFPPSLAIKKDIRQSDVQVLRDQLQKAMLNIHNLTDKAPKRFDAVLYLTGLCLHSGNKMLAGSFNQDSICRSNSYGVVSYGRQVEGECKMRYEWQIYETIAHELGHGLGLQHDQDCKPPEECEDCIMNAIGSLNRTEYFSDCSFRDAHSKRLPCTEGFCGDGMQNDDEECDCGPKPTDACLNCCNMTDGHCTRVKKFTCFTGECCDAKSNCMMPHGSSCLKPSPSNTCYLGGICDEAGTCVKVFKENASRCILPGTRAIGICEHNVCNRLGWGGVPMHEDKPVEYVTEPVEGNPRLYIPTGVQAL